MRQVKSGYKIQTVSTGSRRLEIPVEETVHWEEEWALEILKRKTEEVNYPLGETEGKDFFLSAILSLT